MTFHSRAGLHVEVLDGTALVWVPGHDHVVCLEGDQLTAFELARDGVDVVPEALVVPMAALVELGIVETGAWDRRRVLQLGGAAAAAAVAIVGLPTPSAAQSAPTTTTSPPAPLTCPLNVVAAVNGPAAPPSAINVLGNRGTVVVRAPYAIDTTGLDPAVYGSSYSITETSATLTMSSGASYSNSTGLGPTTTAAVGGVATSPGVPTFGNVQFPNGTYGTAGSNPVRLARVSIAYSLTFTSPAGQAISCNYLLSWNVVTQLTGTIILGGGALSFTPTINPA